MKFEVEYARLADCINLLDKLKLKGLKSIHRTRLSKDLGEKLNKVAEEQEDIKKEYATKDKDGEPVVEKDDKGNESYVYEDDMALRKALLEFAKERYVVDSGDSQVYLKSVKSALENDESDWDGAQAYTFEYLYSALSGDESEEE